MVVNRNINTPHRREEVFIMPGFDGTGPRGEGAMTGGGFGACAPDSTGYGRSSARGFGQGRGLRRGYGPGFGPGLRRGYGRGMGQRSGSQDTERWYGPAYGSPYSSNPNDEVEVLRAEADTLRCELNTVTRRLEELEAKASQSES